MTLHSTLLAAVFLLAGFGLAAGEAAKEPKKDPKKDAKSEKDEDKKEQKEEKSGKESEALAVTNKTGDFTFVLPKGWMLSNATLRNDMIVLIGADGKIRSMMLEPETGDAALTAMKEQYDEAFPRLIKEYKLEKSEVVKLASGIQALRMAHTNADAGSPVRQVYYYFDLAAGKRFRLAATVTPEDAANYDKDVEAVMNSITPVKK